MSNITAVTPFALTAKGHALQLKVQAGMCKLELVGAKIGDGFLQEGQTIESLTALVHEIPTADGSTATESPIATLAEVYKDTDARGRERVMVHVYVKNGNNDSTRIRECAILAKDTDNSVIIYGYINLGDSSMPFEQYNGTTPIVYNWKFPLYISNEANINMDFGFLAGVSREDFNAHVESENRKIAALNVINTLGVTSKVTSVDSTHVYIVAGSKVGLSAVRAGLMITFDPYDMLDSGDSNMWAYLIDLSTGDIYKSNTQDSDITFENTTWTKVHDASELKTLSEYKHSSAEAMCRLATTEQIEANLSFFTDNLQHVTMGYNNMNDRVYHSVDEDVSGHTVFLPSACAPDDYTQVYDPDTELPWELRKGTDTELAQTIGATEDAIVYFERRIDISGIMGYAWVLWHGEV